MSSSMEMIKDELQFYSKFTRPLIFHLPDAKDRVRAAGWVKKIREVGSGNERLKTDYIKLLLFALQRKKLVGIFADDPEEYDKLEEFPPEFDLNNMARALIQKEQLERVDRIRKQLRGQIGDYPPYTTDCSSDYREYAAAQDIPGFGVHCYYAFSKEPINFWQRADRGIYPKIARSAVDTMSAVPLGADDKTEEICICLPPPGEKDPECKATVHKSDKKKKRSPKKKLGRSPPTQPMGTAPSSETRTPPTWSSNLMEVKDLQTVEKARSTGAIPKIRTGKQKKRAPKRADDSDIEEAELKEMENVLKDYSSREIRSRRRRTSPRGRTTATSEYDDLEDVASVQDVERDERLYTDEVYDDIDRSQYQEDLEEDALLLEQFKYKSSESDARRTYTERRQQVGSSVPAGAGIPLTTPKPSPCPKRHRSSEKLYASAEPLAAGTGAKPKRPPSHLKEPGVDKLFEDALALSEETDLVEPIEEDEQRRMREMEMEPEEPPVEPVKPAVQGQSMGPVQKGSAVANAVISDFYETFQTAGTQQESEADRTPPIFSKDPRIRERAKLKIYTDDLLEDVDEWIPGPQYFADKHEFVPYDPRDQRRAAGEMDTSGLIFDQLADDADANFLMEGEDFAYPESPEPPAEDTYGLPFRVEIGELKFPPRQRVQRPYRFQPPQQLEDAQLFDITEAEIGLVGDVTPTTPPSSPGVAGYKTPEHLKLPRRETPPAYQGPPPFRPLPSPGEELSPPLIKYGDEFFFDMEQEAPPLASSPPLLSPADVNFLTVSEISSRAGGIVSGIPSENIFGVQSLTEEACIDFLFEEDEKMKEFIRNVSNIDAEGGLFDEEPPSGRPQAVSRLFPEEEPYVWGATLKQNSWQRRDTS
ncbi:hypothetical protein JTB14_013964 [Gonioctena quinquepunctata]|nr:hypothetical protein JTB14_013964 [Gonioctena quinquepunctata]